MNDRLKFRAGFKVCYYDKDGNDKELILKVNDCFAIENGGETIVVHADIIGELLSDSGILAQGLEYMRANFCYGNDYYLIDKLEYLDQCTGLKDRNGRFIYENDLIKLLVARNRGWIRKGTIAPVEWRNFSCCGFMLSCMGNLTEKCAKNCEVIGNIHENKELLK